MASRIDIINFLKTLDDTKLNKLYDIAMNVRMLFPEDDLLLTANMTQMILKSEELAAIHFPEWDNTNSDFGRFLVELIALFSEKDFWYANSFGNESVLRTMGIYSNAYLRAIELGVEPQLNNLASVQFDVEFEPKDPTLISVTKPFTRYEPGALVISKNFSSAVFTNPDTFNVTDSLAVENVTVNMKVGKPFFENFTFNGEHVYINNRDIDISTTKVTINGATWKLVPGFGASSKVDKHFIVVPEQNGAAKIYFGDGVNGAAPSVGSLVSVFYIFGSGAESNEVGLTSATYGIAKQNPERGVRSASPLSDNAVDGVNASTIDQIKSEAPKVSRIRGVVINEEDLVDFLTLESDVAKASAVYNNGTIVFYAMKTDRTDLFADTSRADELQIKVSDVSVNIGYIITCQQSVIQPIPPLLVRVKTQPLTNNARVKAEVESVCRNFYDPLVNGDYGKNFVYNDLYLSILNGVEEIVGMDLLDQTAPSNTYPQLINMPINYVFEEPITSDGDPNQNIFVEVTHL